MWFRDIDEMRFFPLVRKVDEIKAELKLWEFFKNYEWN